ncbi:KamA family radical SAM protein [candidate division KSB1 bacterium]|nr:KamA family radical SAM protein [candidate division KSB1 bacterium]
MRLRGEAVFSTFSILLKRANPDLMDIFESSSTLEDARDSVFHYLTRIERLLLNQSYDIHALERVIVRDCIRTLKNIFSRGYEKKIGFSALNVLWNVASKEFDAIDVHVSMGFMEEFIHLFRGIASNSGVYSGNHAYRSYVESHDLSGRQAALARTKALDKFGKKVCDYFARYPSGLDENIVDRRNKNRRRILDYFSGTENDWQNSMWHLQHIIKDIKVLSELLDLTDEQKNAVQLAGENYIPFGITPYYLSLMDYKEYPQYDHAIRAQVIPPLDYIKKMILHRNEASYACDFMGEHDTSPVELVTRRYPGIAIFKPFNTCAQICVYCQRNWEVGQVMEPRALARRETRQKALAWFDEHPNVTEILVTGGDPIVMKDKVLADILSQIAAKPHIRRIRIGTRTPVVLPQRWTDDLMAILTDIHEPGHREVAIVTHIEHSYEITPEALAALQKIRKSGLSVYNQQVFTFYNSRRFESSKLRHDLRLVGVDPYYTFNLKDKKETENYMVPVARILQERKEEARLMPGLERTDAIVFNLPRLGKNNIQAGQDHQVIGIMPDGARVYEFLPWEKNITYADSYYYTDVPIYDYIKRLKNLGEDVEEYRSIWYYF